MSRRVVVAIGNIGSGKTTLLKALFNEAEVEAPNRNILVLEPIKEWKEPLEAFKASGSPEDQLILQTVVSRFAKMVLDLLKANPDKNFFIERSVQEHISIFLDKDRLGEEAYWDLVCFYQKNNFDKYITEMILLDTSVEECHRRVLQRGQHGDSGTSKGYLEFLGEKYRRLFHDIRVANCGGNTGITVTTRNFSRPKSIVFVGNIGSGKTTSIEMVKGNLELLGVPVVTFKERIDLWGPDLESFKFSQLPEDLVRLQCKIAECGKEIYDILSNQEPETVYLVERSVQENILVFVKPHLDSGFITQSQYDEIVSVWKKYDYDSLIETVGLLETSPTECHRRVSLRGQDGDSGISIDYLEGLQRLYKTLLSKRVYYKKVEHNIPVLDVIPHFVLLAPSKIIAFTGNIGSGKSTAIRKAAIAYPDSETLLEPVSEWGEDLCRFKETGKVEDLMVLQKNISSFAKTVYNRLTQHWSLNKPWYFIERSNYEHDHIFCKPSLASGFWTEEQYLEATIDYRNFNFDDLVTDVLFFDVSPEECHRRVSIRGQDGDESVDKGYLEYLGGLYGTLYSGKTIVPGNLQRVIGKHKQVL